MEKNPLKKFNLTTWIFIGLIGGLITGIILNLWVPSSYFKDEILINTIFYVIGNGFIRLMKMLVVPLVFCSITCGVASNSDVKTLGKIGVRSIIFYLATTALAVAVAIMVANFIHPGSGLDMSAIQAGAIETAQDTSIGDTLLNIIPENPFQAFSEGSMLQVIVFSVIVGMLLVKLGSKTEKIAQIIEQGNDLMMGMTELVMKIAPLGVFCMIAKTFSTLGFDAVGPLLKYMGSVSLGLLLQCCVVYMILLLIFARLNPFRFLRKFFPVMAFAFSTSSSNAVIPMNIDTLEEKIGVSRTISSFTIPLGATINMDGTAIMQGVAVCFAAQAYGIHLGIGGYLTVIATATLASIGTAGIPSVGLVTLSMVFSSVGLPVEAIALIMGVDRILDMMRTAVNITGDAVCTTVIARMDGELDKNVFYDRDAVQEMKDNSMGEIG